MAWFQEWFGEEYLESTSSRASFDASDRSFNKRITIGQRRYLERVRGYDLGEITAMILLGRKDR